MRHVTLQHLHLREDSLPTSATPIATTPSQHLQALPQSFFARPAKQVAPELIGSLLVKWQADGEISRPFYG